MKSTYTALKQQLQYEADIAHGFPNKLKVQDGESPETQKDTAKSS